MDPDSNLTEALELAKSIQEGAEREAEAITEDFATSYADLERDAARLGALVEALDSWIVKGGFLPRRWQR